MRHRVLSVVWALATACPTLALAQQPAAPAREGGFELSVGAGATYLDQQLIRVVKITDSTANRVAPGLAVSVGYHLSRMWSLSVGTFAGYTKPATVLEPFGALSWTPNIDAKASPFITLGGGVTNVSWSGFRVTSQYGVHLGVGLRLSLGERMALRLEGRGQYEKFRDASMFPKAAYNGTGTLGLSWFLGGRRAPVSSVGVNPPMVALEAFGATQQLAATLMDNAGRLLTRRAVAWSSSNEAVATVTANGLVTAVGDGSATITAASEAVSGTANVTVSQTAATLAVAPVADTLTAIGQTRQLAASGQDANNNPIANPQVTWSSSAPAVTVNASGLATAVRNGTVTVTAADAGGRTATATITVAQAIVSVSVTPAAATVNAAGGRIQFTAQATDANGRSVTGKVITWTGSAPDVVSLGPTGVATAVGNGTAQVTATVQDQSGSAMVTVAIPVRAAPVAAPAAPPAELPAVNATLVLRNVNFRPNSAQLPPEAHADLDALAQAIQAIPNARWEVGGYTSSMGNAARNQALSRRRALAVRTYLVQQGVPSARLVAVGYGAQNPVANNATAAGRRQNMRVEIKRLR